MKREGCIGFFSWGSPGSPLRCLSFEATQPDVHLQFHLLWPQGHTNSRFPKWSRNTQSLGIFGHLVLSGFVIHFISIEDFCPPGKRSHIPYNRRHFRIDDFPVPVWRDMLVPWRVDHDPPPCRDTNAGGWTDVRHWAFQLEVAFVHLPMDRNVRRVLCCQLL